MVDLFRQRLLLVVLLLVMLVTDALRGRLIQAAVFVAAAAAVHVGDGCIAWSTYSESRYCCWSCW